MYKQMLQIIIIIITHFKWFLSDTVGQFAYTKFNITLAVTGMNQNAT